MKLEVCPRCKQKTLDRENCGESQLYTSRHLLCVSCFYDEDTQINNKGTNDLPETLVRYGPANDYNYECE